MDNTLLAAPWQPALLDLDDPAPFTLINPEGQAPMVLVCDHASKAIPARLNDLGLSAAERARHIAWDIGAAEVTRWLAIHLDAPAVLCGYSRLVIDCNRPPGDPTSIVQVSDGTRIPGNCSLDDTAIEARLNAVFWPYHQAITQTLAPRWQHGYGQAPALVAIHSFTPVLGGLPRPWQIGVLWNRDPRLAEPLLAQFRACSGLCVGDNEPYSGRNVGFTMNTHGDAAGLPHAELEIRQDLLGSPADCIHWAKIIGDVLTAVLRHDRSIYTVRHY